MRDAFIRAGRQALGFGDHERCPQCDARWVRPPPESSEVIAGSAERFAALLREGTDRDRERGVWSPIGYTIHTGDWLRVWAERLVAVAEAPARPLPSIDQDALAAVRGYDHVSKAAALHVLRTGVRELLDVHRRVAPVDFDHPDFGPADADAILSWLAHEVDHHAWDVARLRGLL